MDRLLIKRLFPATCVLACSWTLQFTTNAAPNEPIQVTGSTNYLQLPPSRAIEELSRPSDFLGTKLQSGEPSYAPILPPPGASSPVLNRNVREYLDKKNNWMFQSPNDNDQDGALKRIFGVREHEFTGSERKTKTVMERYVESDRPEKPTARPEISDTFNRALDSDSIIQSSSESSFFGRERSSSIIPELNPGVFFQSSMSPESILPGRANEIRPFSLPQFGEVIPKATPGAAAGRDKTQMQKDFERLLNPRQPGFGRWSDPINQQPDSTRSIINPITAQRPGMLSSESLTTPRSDNLPSIAPGANLAVRNDFLLPTRSLPLGSSSMAPAISAPLQAPISQPKPPVLEIPRPKF
jgi:hypothetical protein